MLGVAELTFPHPKGWTVEGASEGVTLDRLTVRELTGVFRKVKEKPPNCMRAWEKALGGPADWRTLGALFSNRLLTPKDYARLATPSRQDSHRRGGKPAPLDSNLHWETHRLHRRP